MRLYNTLIKYEDILLYQSNTKSLPNLCVLIDNDEAVLFYPNILFSQVHLFDSLTNDIGINKIKYIVIDNLQGIPFNFVEIFEAYGFNTKFIMRNTLADQYIDFIPTTSSYFIKEINYRLQLKSNRVIEFIPTSFLSSSSSFISYDTQTNTLFSQYLFSSTTNDVLFFHKKHLPSSDFLRPVLKIVSNLNIDRVIPMFGGVYSKEEYQKLIASIYNYDFFNNNTVSKKVQTKYNYIDICNQILHRLKTLFGDQEVLELLADSEIIINGDLVEITNDNSANYQLWHRLFEIIYAKKGFEWLAVVEAIVDKVNKVYDIEKPLIYESFVASTNKKLQELTALNTELQEENTSLQVNLDKTSDKLIRCPITHVYNESFFKEFIDNQLHTSKDISLLFIGIDNIEHINKTYTKEEGNLTLKNMVYLLNQIKSPEHVLFKRNGPGFILCFKNSDNAYELAEQILLQVKESDIFIENITASISILNIDEYSDFEAHQSDFVTNLIDKGERLLKQDYLLSNQIIIENQTIVEEKNQKILIVDEDEIVYDILANALKNENFDVVKANDGIEAIEIANEQQIAMIIANQNVAKLNGFRIKAKLNQSIATQDIPFFIITFNKSIEFINRANQLNISMVLEKPLILEEIIGQVKKILGK